MKFYKGRLIDHVHVRSSDFEASKRFYKAVLGALEIPILGESETHLAADELWLDQASNSAPPTGRMHLAFQASDREAVQRFHRAAIEAGGCDNGPPGERAYHPGYFAAYVLDPDCNNIEAVTHGRVVRSAAAIEETFEG